MPQSNDTLKTQPMNDLSDVSHAILSYSRPELQHRALRREEKLFKQQALTRPPLAPASTMADETLACQLEEPQIFVLYVPRSGRLSTQRSYEAR